MWHSQYHLGIDLGTTYTAAALCRDGDGDGDGRPEVVPLCTTSAAVATVVFLAPDGHLVIGEAAQRRALTEPRRIARGFKRRIGDGTPVVVGGTAIPADEIAARFVARVVAETAAREGGPAATIAVTHPVGWGDHKRESFGAALAAAGLPDVTFLSEPQAAAVGYASSERIEPGAVVGVYDLGGGTFDAAVVRKLADGGFEVLGRPAGIEDLGGMDFDEKVFEHVQQAVGAAWQDLDPTDPAVQTAVAGLRRECTAAKEALSADTETMIPVMLPGIHTQVRLGRAEFEDMIRPAVVETVEALQRAIASSGVAPADLEAVVLVGGSSRIPLVSQLVSAELGRSIAVDADPKGVVAAGAALAARGPLEAEVVPASVTAVPAADEPDDAFPYFAPPVPELTFDAPPSDDDLAAPPRRRRTLVLAAGLAVAATFALSATVASGVNPLPLGSVGSASADETAGGAGAMAAGIAIDPWTGTTPTLTTPPGPQRPAAVAALVRPVARNTPTGAAGASATTPAPAPAGDPAPVVAGGAPPPAEIPVVDPVTGGLEQPGGAPPPPVDEAPPAVDQPAPPVEQPAPPAEEEVPPPVDEPATPPADEQAPPAEVPVAETVVAESEPSQGPAAP